MHHRRFSGLGYRLLVAQEGRHGFESHSENNILAVGDAALNTAAVVGRRGESGEQIYR